MPSPAIKEQAPRAAVVEPTEARPRRRFSLIAIRDRMRRNMGLRLISIGLAIGLWIFVNAGQHESLKQFTVPVVYHGLPHGFMIVNQHPELVTIQVSGPRTLLSLIDPNRVPLRLDLSGAGVGQASFKVGPDAFTLPRQTTVQSILPSQIVLDIDHVVTRNVPVHLVTVGKLAEGYRLAVSEIAPATITLRGPSHELARTDQVDTEAMDVEGLNASSSSVLGLTMPAGHIKIDPDEVTVRVSVAPVIGDREFRGVPINVRNSDWRFKVDPTRAVSTCAVRCPIWRNSTCRTRCMRRPTAWLPGVHTLALQISLPEGIELVRQTPVRVKVRMSKERRPTVEYQAQ